MLLLLILGFISAVHTVAFGHPRYHLPLVPLLCVYAGAALATASWVRLREGLAQAVAPAAVCLLWIGIWSREVLVVEADRIRNLLAVLLG